jgi:hypothetical protein
MGKQITRRELLGKSLLAAALGVPLSGQTTGQTAKRLKVVVAGAHRTTLNPAVAEPWPYTLTWIMTFPLSI